MFSVVSALVVCDGKTLVRGRTMPLLVRFVKNWSFLYCFKNWLYPKPSIIMSTTFLFCSRQTFSAACL